MEIRTIEVPTDKWETAEKKIENLRSRAAKKGMAGHVKIIDMGEITKEVVKERAELNLDGEVEVPGVVEVYRFKQIAFHVEPIKINGWSFLATLNHLEPKVNLVLAVPGTEDLGLNLHEDYGAADPWCDHCKTSRDRRDTYLVRHEDGTIKQVGSSCLKDFLGHDPSAMLFCAQWSHLVDEFESEFSSEGGMWMGRPDCWGLWYVLRLASASIMERGFVSRKAARDNEYSQLWPTADEVSLWLEPPKKKGNDWKDPKITAQSDRLAFGTWWWLQELSKTGQNNEYLDNLTALSKVGYVPRRGIGLAASAPASYRRAQEKILEVEREYCKNKDSEHIGEEGQRVQLTVRVEKVIELEGNYGITYLHKMRTLEGDLVTWFGSKCLIDGATYTMRAAIKRHDVYKDTKQTVITRPTKIEEVEDPAEQSNEVVSATCHQCGERVEHPKFDESDGTMVFSCHCGTEIRK